MSARHFINDPTLLVNTALRAVTLTNPRTALDEANKIVYLRPDPAQKQPVAIISGGGSGHEPSFAGMVGRGLLSAAVAGTIFASPSTDQVRIAITGRVDHADKGGVLVTVMNYTGDILNFGVAVEKARAQGVDVEMVVVGDDVGVGRARGGKVVSNYHTPLSPCRFACTLGNTHYSERRLIQTDQQGRRGIAGTVLVHKVSGALAARGASLSEVARVARLAAANLASVGASLEHVHVPGRKTVGDDDGLAQGEVEIGMGIHNEAGSGRDRLELPALVERMLAQLLDQKDQDRAFVKMASGSPKVVLMVNNLGGVSVLEMGGVTAEVVAQLEKTWGIRPVRILSGTYMTSLNGNGFSISLLDAGVDAGIEGGVSLVQLLDDPCEATGWSAPISAESWGSKNSATREGNADEQKEVQPSGLKIDAAAAQKALTAALERVISVEAEVTKYDTVVGDGDCGIGLKRGAEAVLQNLASKPLSGDAAVDVANIVAIVEKSMDGTSGALYAIYLNALVRALKDVAARDKATAATPQVWAEALQRSSEGLSAYTPARPGDRTLVDALHPFVETLSQTGDLTKATLAAREGAESTKGMQASLGRSVYVGGSGFEQVPDPGAWGLASFFLGLAGLPQEK
ncbi:hypothetical protein RB594_000810 [Gaeumannomyces avenae]